MSKYLDLLRRARAEMDESSRVADCASNLDMREQALVLLAKLRGYTLPAGRMPVAREMAQRLRGLEDPREIAEALGKFEAELIALGGEYDPQLVAAVEAVSQVFPGVRLVS
jgi:hypothetical protein